MLDIYCKDPSTTDMPEDPGSLELAPSLASHPWMAEWRQAMD
ncbi:MAG: hypothetical protein ACRERT_05110 [Pseudomonas sp.]